MLSALEARLKCLLMHELPTFQAAKNYKLSSNIEG